MLAEKALSRFPDKIVAVCEMTRTELIDLGTRKERVEVIPNGIDFQHIQLVPASPVRTDLAYCGRLKNHKNVHLLIQAVALMKRSQPKVSAVIIGDGPESADLHSLTKRLDVVENIIFTGELDDSDEVVRWLKASKIFVHPSTKEGGGSITLFEANACGLPVIAMRCSTGIDPTLIREGENAYWVQPDPGQIASTALRLLGSPDELAKNAALSREFAAQFDWNLVAARYEEVYSSLVYRNS